MPSSGIRLDWSMKLLKTVISRQPLNSLPGVDMELVFLKDPFGTERVNKEVLAMHESGLMEELDHKMDPSGR